MDEQTGAKDSKEGAREKNSAAQRRGEQPPYRRGGRDNRQQDNQRLPSQPPTAKNSLNMSELRELAELINEHGFTDFEFENENIRVRLRKELAPQIIQAAPQPQQMSFVPTTSASAQPAQAPNVELVNDDANLQKITSPIVGTFYRAPSPEAESFVKIGSHVSPETTVCIVEAMKLMNEIPAEISGEIVQIYVENGQPVEYGQPLFAVK